MVRPLYFGTKRILIADDVRLITHTMAGALRDAGYRVETAGDGEECLEKVVSFHPDLVILDIMIPKVHGIEIMRNIHGDELLRRIGIMVCTAKSFKTELAQLEDLGVFAILVKPFEMPELVEKVGEYFAKFPLEDKKPVLSVKTSVTGTPFGLDIEKVPGTLTLWGTRGSTPTPGAKYMRHGGNTSCFEIRSKPEVFIFDAGTGIRELGHDLMNTDIRKVHLFITHTHWDHIQGFPFFSPAYDSDFKITVYGAEGFRRNLKSIFHGQVDRDYFPVQLEDMKANLDFRGLDSNPVSFGDVEISWEYSNHPGATVGYKIDIDGKKIGWFPDNEFLQGYIGSPEELSRDDELTLPHQTLIEFLADIDILIHEAQYTVEEYPDRIGRGHTSISNASLLMKLAGVPRWIVTHHNPDHDDEILDEKLNATKLILQQIGHDANVSHGFDGMREYLI